MKKIILRYGGYAALFELIFFVLTWLFIYVTNAGHKTQGYIGYVDIICPLLFVYFGIRYYRDHLNNGSITFMKALGLGLLIIIVPAAAFGIIETVYVLYIDPKFYETVGAYDLEQYHKTLSPAAYALKVKEAQQQLALEKSPVYNFIAMFLTIGSVGVIMTVISSAMLMRKAK
jgi:hypothetical protein